MEIDRKAFFASLGGAAVAGLMSAEAKADALEDFLSQQLDEQVARNRDGGEAAKTFFPPPPPGKEFPTAAEIDAQIETRNYRRGAGGLFANANQVKRLPPMPARPTIVDYFHLRFNQFNNHVLQSATLARKNGMTDEIVLACLLHDVVQCMMKTDHGWWGAQLFEPYVPELYRAMFGYDYEPPPHILANYQFIRKHKWYILPRQVTLNDLYAFDANAVVTLDPYIDLLGKYFKTPKEGLGNDNSPVAHMWRTIAMPDTAL
jgi:hypothetical protein